MVKKKLFLFLAWGGFILWCLSRFSFLASGADGEARVIIGAGFAIALMIRSMSSLAINSGESPKSAYLMALVGVGLYLVGRVFMVNQGVWLGMLFLLYGISAWSLDAAALKLIRHALVLIYWIHPLPSQLIGPLQLLMQRVSVKGAEWLLHAVNEPVWADGLILRAGRMTYEVPAECSGMKTAVVVILCVFGTFMLLRIHLRAVRIVTLILLGWFQTILLNILRITFMVTNRDVMSVDFLHDTGGLFLLASIALIQTEIYVWQKVRVDKRNPYRRQKKNLIAQNVKRMFAWRKLPLVGRVIWAVILFAFLTGAGFAVHKRSTPHWCAMVTIVAEEMTMAGQRAAVDAAEAVLAKQPDEVASQKLLARALMSQKRFAEALDLLRQVPESSRDDACFILLMLAMHGTGESDEVMGVIDQLQTGRGVHPVQHVLAAEIYAEKGNLEACVHHLTLAGSIPQMKERVRRLFPFLASHNRWDVIVAIDPPLLYQSTDLLFLAVNAHLFTHDEPSAERLLQEHISLWEDDDRFLALCARFINSETDLILLNGFEQLFVNQADEFSDEVLYTLVGTLVDLDRMDLVFKVCRILQERDSRHPAVSMILAQNIVPLLNYRDEQLVLAADAGEEPETVEMPVVFDGFMELDSRDQAAVEQYSEAELKKAIDRLVDANNANRSSRGSSFIHFLLSDAYRLAGQPLKALKVLENRVISNPQTEIAANLRMGQLLYELERYEEAYEMVLPLTLEKSGTEMGEILQIRCLIGMGLPFHALNQMMRLRENNRLPPDLLLPAAGLLDAFGYADEGLFWLRPFIGGLESPLVYQLLLKTGRWREAENYRARIGQIPGVPNQTRSMILPAPAERAIQWQAFELADYDVVGLRDRANELQSPYLHHVFDCKIGWVTGNDSARPLDELIAEWRYGRNADEDIACLHTLSMLLAADARYDDAIKVIQSAIQLSPQSPFLHRMLIALSGGDTRFVADAYASCPGDPEIWLAAVITAADRDALQVLLQKASDAPLYPVETLLRAADWLLRHHELDAAGMLVRAMELQSREPPPGFYAVAYDYALAIGNGERALQYATTGAELMPDSLELLKAMVKLKMLQGQADPLLVSNLHRLVDAEPDVREWRERLGAICFQQGDMRASLNAFMPFFEKGFGDLQPSLILIAADAARQSDELEMAIQALDYGQSKYPENVAIANNLLYTQAEAERLDSSTVAHVLELLSSTSGELAPSLLDTAVVVSYQIGDIEGAREYFDSLLPQLDSSHDVRWYEFSFNAAEAAIKAGIDEDALAIYDQLIAAPERSLVSRPRLDRLEIALATMLEARDAENVIY